MKTEIFFWLYFEQNINLLFLRGSFLFIKALNHSEISILTHSRLGFGSTFQSKNQKFSIIRTIRGRKFFSDHILTQK